MGREIRRVPLDFSWPVDRVWDGYLMPDDLRPDTCSRCDGTGYNDATRAIREDFYDFARTGRRWCDAITQDEVAALVRRGRLMDFTHRAASPERPSRLLTKRMAKKMTGADEKGLRRRMERGDVVREGAKYRVVDGWLRRSMRHVPTAEEVNATNRHGDPRYSAFGSHDSINAWILLETRARRMGVWGRCPRCKGHGHLFRDAAHERAYDTWRPTDPPTGEGYQLWETVTEGSPQSPVFERPEGLARWLAANSRDLSGSPESRYLGWMEFILGPGWAPSLVVDGRGARGGVEAMVGHRPETVAVDFLD